SRDGSGLASLDAGAAAAVSRRGVRFLWSKPPDDRVGLARVHARIGLRARDVGGHRLRVASLARRARSGPRRHRAALLESSDDSRSTPVTNASPPRGTRRTRRAIAVWWRVVVVALLLAAGCSREPAKSGAMTIAVIPKGT